MLNFTLETYTPFPGATKVHVRYRFSTLHMYSKPCASRVLMKICVSNVAKQFRTPEENCQATFNSSLRYLYGKLIENQYSRFSKVLVCEVDEYANFCGIYKDGTSVPLESQCQQDQMGSTEDFSANLLP